MNYRQLIMPGKETPAAALLQFRRFCCHVTRMRNRPSGGGQQQAGSCNSNPPPEADRALWWPPALCRTDLTTEDVRVKPPAGVVVGGVVVVAGGLVTAGGEVAPAALSNINVDALPKYITYICKLAFYKVCSPNGRLGYINSTRGQARSCRHVLLHD